ncbi:MAG: DUF481 domain-containing protein, partial [Thiohalomonadales bacterium]
KSLSITSTPATLPTTDTSTIVSEPISAAEAQQNIRPEATEGSWADFLPPRDDKYDWLQLSSNEWIKGEFIALYNYVVEFDSDDLNILKIDWEDVKKIYSAGIMSIKIEPHIEENGVLNLYGELTLDGDKIIVSANGDQYSFDREQIVSIVNGADKEIDYWRAKASFGGNVKSGNAETVDMNLTVNAKRQNAESRFTLEYTDNYSRAEGVDTSNNRRLNTKFDKFYNTRLFWRVVNAEYVRDIFKNIDRQLSLATEFGYQIMRAPKKEWEISGGLGVIYKRFVSVGVDEEIDNISPSVGMNTIFDLEISSRLDFLINFRFEIVDKNSGSFTHYLKSTLSSELNRDLDFDVSFVWDRVQEPQADAEGVTPEQNDYQMIVAITYEL